MEFIELGPCRQCGCALRQYPGLPVVCKNIICGIYGVPQGKDIDVGQGSMGDDSKETDRNVGQCNRCSEMLAGVKEALRIVRAEIKRVRRHPNTKEGVPRKVLEVEMILSELSNG